MECSRGIIPYIIFAALAFITIILFVLAKKDDKLEQLETLKKLSIPTMESF